MIILLKDRIKFIEFILTGLFAFILVITTPFLIPYKAVNYDQISIIKLGIPINYILQHTLLTPDISEFPVYLTFLSPWDNPTEILYKNFVCSLLIAWIVIYSVFNFVKFIRPKIVLKIKNDKRFRKI